MAQTTFEENIQNVIIRYAKYDAIGMSEAIAEIKAAVAIEILPDEPDLVWICVKEPEYQEGYNQAIKDVTEKLK